MWGSRNTSATFWRILKCRRAETCIIHYLMSLFQLQQCYGAPNCNGDYEDCKDPEKQTSEQTLRYNYWRGGLFIHLGSELNSKGTIDTNIDRIQNNVNFITLKKDYKRSQGSQRELGERSRYSDITFAFQIFPFLFLKCLLPSRLTLFRSPPFIWLGYCNHYNLVGFLWSTVLNILCRTMVYVASSQKYVMNSLWVKIFTFSVTVS
jgi:hypothetical protein